MTPANVDGTAGSLPKPTVRSMTSDQGKRQPSFQEKQTKPRKVDQNNGGFQEASGEEYLCNRRHSDNDKLVLTMLILP
jgi:hypothetical protein